MTMSVWERSAELRGIDMAQIAAVKALMETLNCTLEEAMLKLKYSLSDKPKFEAALA